MKAVQEDNKNKTHVQNTFNQQNILYNDKEIFEERILKDIRFYETKINEIAFRMYTWLFIISLSGVFLSLYKHHTSAIKLFIISLVSVILVNLIEYVRSLFQSNKYSGYLSNLADLKPIKKSNRMVIIDMWFYRACLGLSIFGYLVALKALSLLAGL